MFQVFKEKTNLILFAYFYFPSFSFVLFSIFLSLEGK